MSCQYELSHDETNERFCSTTLILIYMPAKAPFHSTRAICKRMNKFCACVVKEFYRGTYMHHLATGKNS
jgi:hypothetical protein